MHSFLRSLSKSIGQLNEWVGRTVSWLTLVLVIVMCVDVLMRYFFSNTKAWIIELEWHLFALLFLLGAAYALKHDKHVRVDLFYAKFTKREKAWINLIGSLVFLIPWCLLIIITSYQYALGSFLINESSPNPGGLPARYIIKFSISIGMGLLLLQGIATIADAIIVLTDKNTQTSNTT